jgi:hypothetical protein
LVRYRGIVVVGEGSSWGEVTRSLIVLAPIVLMRWMRSWITKTVMRRDGMVECLSTVDGHEALERVEKTGGFVVDCILTMLVCWTVHIW